MVVLVRLHLHGFVWGDCSLSNTLFRRDAGALSAYLVDAETGELHTTVTASAASCSTCRRRPGLPDHVEPAETGHAVEERYRDLWSELTAEEVVAGSERYRSTTGSAGSTRWASTSRSSNW